MKHKIAAVLMGAMMITGVSAAPVFAEDTGIVTASLLNVRSGPSTSYDVIDQLADGFSVIILDDTGIGWYQIQSELGIAFVSADYITINGTVNLGASDYPTGTVSYSSATASEGTAAEESTYSYSSSYDYSYDTSSYSSSYDYSYDTSSYDSSYDYSYDTSNDDSSYDYSYDTSDDDSSYDYSYDTSSDDSSYTYEETTDESSTYSSTWDGEVLTASKGVVYGPSGKETYYNLDMSGVISIMQSLGYDYEYWVRSDGVKMYGDYIMIAANLDVHPRGSLVETSLGTGIVCDTGGFAASNPNQVDIAVTW